MCGKKSFPCSGACSTGITHVQAPMGNDNEVSKSQEHFVRQLTLQPAASKKRRNRVRGGGMSPGIPNRRASWCLAEDMCFLGLLSEMMIANNIDNDNLTRVQWEILLDQYNEKTPGKKADKHQLYCRVKTLKQLYSLNRALRSKKGWTWDESRQMAVAPDNKAWEELVESRRQYTKVRRRPFPQYETLDRMFGKYMARDLKEDGEDSASSKGQLDGAGKDNSVQFVRPLAQMPPELVHAQEQSPIGANAAKMDATSHDSPSGSSSSRERSSNKRRRDGHLSEAVHFEVLASEHERTQCAARYVQDREGWKDDVREAHNKIRSLPGVTLAQRVAGMEACRNPTTRVMVMMFDPDELQYWLEKITREKYPESVDVRERFEVSPGAPVPDRA